MEKVFIFRHQHGGFVTSPVFKFKPTDDQLEALAAIADAQHGPGWAMACEVDLIVDNTVPEVGTTGSGAGSGDEGGQVSLSVFICDGVGHVEELP